jgi:hypothetical protein
VQNLALRFAGANGISNNGSIGDHLTFSDLDISWIGGGNLQGSGIRYGAGIVFWNNSHDNVVERNRIWQIYDSGITNQGIAETSPISVYNLTYRNNLILNASMSIESWLNSTAVNGSTMHDIQIYNNSMANPNSWRGGQNPINGIAGHGLMIGASPNVSAYNITVENNAFTSFASNVALGMNTFDWAKGQMTMDYNDWYDNVPMQVYTTVAPHLWQAFNTWTAAYPAEQHGIQAHPHYANMFGLDFHLLEGSALIGKGVNLYTKGVVEDFDHNPRPTIGPFDIGAFQTQK